MSKVNEQGAEEEEEEKKDNRYYSRTVEQWPLELFHIYAQGLGGNPANPSGTEEKSLSLCLYGVCNVYRASGRPTKFRFAFQFQFHALCGEIKCVYGESFREYYFYYLYYKGARNSEYPSKNSSRVLFIVLRMLDPSQVSLLHSLQRQRSNKSRADTRPILRSQDLNRILLFRTLLLGPV